MANTRFAPHNSATAQSRAERFRRIMFVNREEFVVGDARYGRKGPALVDVGRVVIYMN